MAVKSKSSTPPSAQPPSWYKESRKKISSPSGAITFTLLRLLEIPGQYYWLTSGLGISLLTRLGARIQPLSALQSTSVLGLDLQHPYHTLILALVAGTSFGQIFWVWGVNDNYFPPLGATAIAIYNTLLNMLNTSFALWALTSQAPRDGSSWPATVMIGVPLYCLGVFLERYSEVQRRNFKVKPENKGKPFAGGLFGLARNINYTGYSFMRAGFALVCGGWIWGALMGGYCLADFNFRAIPWLESHCESKYGQQWREVKKKVPYRLLPGLV